MNQKNAGEVVYGEAHHILWWLDLFIFVACAGLVVAIVIGVIQSNPLTVALGCIVLAVLVFVAITFSCLTFEITGEEVTFGFSIFKKRFPRSSLLSCEPFELTFGNYLGYGIRLGRDGTTAYNTRNGPGVKMVFEGAKRPYVVSIDEPQKACALLAPVPQHRRDTDVFTACMSEKAEVSVSAGEARVAGLRGRKRRGAS